MHLRISSPHPQAAEVPLPPRRELCHPEEAGVHGHKDDQSEGDQGRNWGGPQRHGGDEGIHQGEPRGI